MRWLHAHGVPEELARKEVSPALPRLAPRTRERAGGLTSPAFRIHPQTFPNTIPNLATSRRPRQHSAQTSSTRSRQKLGKNHSSRPLASFYTGTTPSMLSTPETRKTIPTNSVPNPPPPALRNDAQTGGSRGGSPRGEASRP